MDHVVYNPSIPEWLTDLLNEMITVIENLQDRVGNGT